MTGLPVLTSPLLDAPGLRHAFFTRTGGVSGGLYASLNMGLGSEDDPAAVAENRTRAAAHLGRTSKDLAAPYQVHSARAIAVDGAMGDDRPQGDAVVTRTPGIVCTTLAADCAPILLADAEARVVGAAHAGWRGALDGIVAGAVEAMSALGADPARMVAVVGPCIAQASYEVGDEFEARFTAADPRFSGFFMPGVRPDKRQFDLPGFVLEQLRRAGVGRSAWIGLDTAADEARFFSNRRAYLRGEPDFGRLMSAIVLV